MLLRMLKAGCQAQNTINNFISENCANFLCFLCNPDLTLEDCIKVQNKVHYFNIDIIMYRHDLIAFTHLIRAALFELLRILIFECIEIKINKETYLDVMLTTDRAQCAGNIQLPVKKLALVISLVREFYCA